MVYAKSLLTGKGMFLYSAVSIPSYHSKTSNWHAEIGPRPSGTRQVGTTSLSLQNNFSCWNQESENVYLSPKDNGSDDTKSRLI